MALASVATADARRATMGAFVREQVATTAEGPRAALLKTWEEFYEAWCAGSSSPRLDVFPLT
eukprot:12115671-Heterocapsa_arctica.AAC.1